MPSHLNTSHLYNSIYDLYTDYSFVSENFYVIPIGGTHRLDALKIRVADWKPRYNRDYSAVFYYEVKTKQEALDILKVYEKFNFKELQNLYTEMYGKEQSINRDVSTTGGMIKFRDEVFLPKARELYKPLI